MIGKGRILPTRLRVTQRNSRSALGTLLTQLGTRGEAHGFLGRANQGAGLAGRIVLSRLGHCVGTTPPPACTYIVPSFTTAVRSAMQVSIVAAGGEIADAAGIDPAPLGLQLVDDLHGANLGRARDGAGGKAGGQRVDGIEAGPDLPSTLETICMTWQ